MASDLFDTFRSFYFSILKDCISNYNRPSKLHLQPRIEAFIDDTDVLDPIPLFML